jgi:hypothetical protein
MKIQVPINEKIITPIDAVSEVWVLFFQMVCQELENLDNRLTALEPE